MITQERLKEVLHYNPDTGIFTWLVDKGSRGKAGAVAGCLNKHNGYIDMFIDSQQVKAHRLVFLYMTGEFPDNDVDHINGIESDNRFDNLRVCTRSQNLQNKRLQKNSKSGVKGVHWHKGSAKWVAQIKTSGKIKTVGSFDDLGEASIAIKAERERLHGEFSRHI